MKKVSFLLGLFVWAQGFTGICNAQNFIGTNNPGVGTNFTFTIGAGATNLSLVVSNNSTAYSYLLIKNGGTPTDTSFDYAARLNGATNEINLESPEFAAGTYGLRVSTPGTSTSEAFKVVLTTNRTDLRTAGYPVSKPLVFSTTGSITNTGSGTWHYFQVDVPSNLLTGWRIVLYSTNATTPGLYVKRGQLPATFIYDKNATGQSIETVTFMSAEATNSTYFIGVYQPSGPAASSTYTLATELLSMTTLAWDPGTADAGTQVFTNQSAIGGDYFFTITTQTTADQVWRTALAVQTNEADVYIRQGTLPSITSYDYASARVGSDGFVLAQSQQFNPGQTWYLMVHATPGAQWTLLTGEAYVQQLPALAPDASSGTNVTMGPEGMHFFKTTISSNTLAWRLWLNGLGNQMYVRQSAAPHPISTSTYDLTQAGQMLVVPSYLNIGSQYFVGVVGNPGLNFTLDSRQQGVTNLNFNTTTNLTISGYGYTTFLVQVPVQQIAWQINVTPSSGTANIAVRRNNVPNEAVNDAYSEPPPGVGASVTLVPPTLSNGSFYLTIYSAGAYTISLFNGQPVITDVDYVFSITNDAPSRVGWRFYRVANTAEQLGSLGWGLDLANQVPNSMIALRRNAVPGQWNYRTTPYNTNSFGTLGYIDLSSTLGFLQQPNHPADIWYIGIYTPNAALGSFILNGNQLTGTPVNFDAAGSTISITNQPAGKFQYFVFTVPTNTFGWDLRITNTTSGQPQMAICRDQLPYDLGTHTGAGNGWPPNSSTNWLSGNQWGAGYDWTGDAYDSDGTYRYGQVMEMGMGNPLEAGTYYVGVLNGSGTVPMTYTLMSRGIGTGFSIPIGTLNFSNGVVANPGLNGREVAYYSLVVPTNMPSWRMELSNNVGETLLMFQKDHLPSISAAAGATPYAVSGGEKLQRTGNEQYLMMPPFNQSNIVAGTYYVAVASEGMNPSPAHLGTNSSAYTLTSFGPIGVTNIGTLDPTGATDILVTNSCEAGQFAAYQFSVPPNTVNMEIFLENVVGSPIMLLRTGNQFTGGSDGYGNDGGQGYQWASSSLINIVDPLATNYTLMVQAVVSGGNASYRIRLHAIQPQPVTFDGGTFTVSGQQAGTWQFFSITVPSNAFGWDVRITNTTSGQPQMAICRDLAPTDLGTHTGAGNGWPANSSTNWPSTYQWAAGYDWTGYTFDSNGSNRIGQIMQMGMGNPLQPGNYIVGVINNGGTAPMSYTLLSRGIGAGFTIPIGTLGFSNGVVVNPGLLGRDVAYYSIVVPTNTQTWRMELSNNVGESLLMFQKDYLPSVAASASYIPYSVTGGEKLQKTGREQYLMMPPFNQSNIVAGTYYLAVASQGMNPISSTLGTNSSSFTLTSYGPIVVTNIGTVDNTGATDILVTNSCEGGQFAAFQFSVPVNTLSLEMFLDNPVGSPMMLLRTGSQFTGGSDSYGNDGGQGYTWQNASLINIVNPAVTNYTLMIQAIASGGDASYRLRIHALGPQPVAFDGGTYTITNQQAGTWQFFSITVPSTPLGWDIRITNATSGQPQLAVCRDTPPTDLGTHTGAGNGWAVNSSTTWPSSYQWGAGYDWTGYTFDNNGSNRIGQILQMGMGNPLQPGNYIVGVINNGGTAPMSYTLMSRGIGRGFTIPVATLTFSNGVLSNPGLLGRDVAYYGIVVPTNLPSWQLELSNNFGESLLMVQKDYLPNIAASANPATYSVAGGKKMQIAGNDQYVLLPVPGQSNIVAGTYYLAVASEGVNPHSAYLGTNLSSFTLYSYGVEGVTNLGPTSAVDLLATNSLRAGQNAFYQFNIPNGTRAVEVRLDNVTGGPEFTMATGTNVTSPYGGYGNDGGVNYTWSSATLITLANPVPTNYSLTVQSYNYNGVMSDSSSTVHIRQMPVTVLAFDASLNGGGISNTASGTLLNGESAFYQVTVPAMLNGQPVIGWKLDLPQTSGSATMRVCQVNLPSDVTPATTPFNSFEAIIVPPYLTPGVWYIEVRGAGLTAYTITSGNLQLKRPGWVMPPVGGLVTTPGLNPAGPLFGDTGVDTNGVALPGDQGTDLAQSTFDYYAITVPPGNSGILRTRLDAISGNPNLYIRAGGAPTLSHNQNGPNGPILYDRNLSANGGSEYGNWVPLNGRFETQLTNGTWYLAVKASGNSNVRYRLRLDTGSVTNLALVGGTVTNQQMVAGDWLYYAVQIPTNAPVNWNVTFSVQLGNVVMYVRDRVPPGDATTVNDLRDWGAGLDSKNHGPYPIYTSPGTYNLPCPPVRPGNTYYLGFRAVNDSTFSVSSGTNGGTIDYTNVIPFYNGFTSTVIPAFGLMKYRVDVPPDAVRWIHHSTNASTVWLYLDQGSAPTMTTSDDWYAINTVNSSFNQFLQTPNSWPWQPGYSYFLAVTNTSASSQPFSFLLNGEGPGSGPFSFTSVVHQPNGYIQLNMSVGQGYTYNLLTSTNLINWTLLTTFTPITNIYTFTDTSAPLVPVRFYRLQEQ